MRSTKDFLPPDEDPRYSIKLNLSNDIVDFIIKQKDRMMISVLEVIEGHVPNMDDIKKYGAIRIDEHNNQIEYLMWRGQPVLVLQVTWKDGKCVVKGESPHYKFPE